MNNRIKHATPAGRPEKMKELFEINKNLFKVGDNYVCVSDKKIRAGIYYVGTGFNGLNIFKWQESQEKEYPNYINKKIIFSTQFIHESIPVLNIENEEDITLHDLAFESFVDYKPFEITCDNYKDYARYGFKKGYQKAKEIFKYTEEDLRKVIEMARKVHSVDGEVHLSDENLNSNWDDFYFKYHNSRLIIQSLQQSKEIESIDVMYEPIGTSINQGFNMNVMSSEFEWNPIILPNGKVKCKVKY